ncbi:MAG: hypothetical protein AB7P21_18010 [Lautropia sp.]
MNRPTWILSLAAVAVLTTAGCASTPKQEMAKPGTMTLEAASRQYKEGALMVENAEKDRKKGEDKIAEGKRQIDEAKIKVERGQTMMSESERVFRENSRSVSSK